MSGNKCSFFNCGKSRRNYKNLRFHVFPADVTYSKFWLLNCGNPNLENLSHELLRYRVICSNHFNDCMYMDAERRKLIRGAVPIKYTACHTEQLNGKILTTPVENRPTSSQIRGTILNFNTKDVTELDLTSPEILKVFAPKTHNPASSNILDHENAASPMLSVTPDTQRYVSEISKLPTHLNNVSLSMQLQNEQLENRCKKLKNLIKKKSATISFLKKKYLKDKRKKFNSKQFSTFQSIGSKTLVSMQINHKLNKLWNSNKKKLSLALYYKSPSTYKYMNRNKIILPGERTVRRWLN